MAIAAPLRCRMEKSLSGPDETARSNSGPAEAEALASVASLSPAALCFIVMSATTAWCVDSVRAELGGPGALPVFKAFLLLGAVILGWLAATQKSVAGAWAVAAGLLLGVPYLGGHSPLAPAAWGLCGVAWAFGLATAVRSAQRPAIAQWAAAAVAGAVLGILYFLIFNGRAYSSVIGPETAMAGIQHADPLYHASLASMIAQYGVVSTGLDGLVPVKYHVLSHFWLGHLAKWMGVPATYAYMIGPQVIGIPLLYFSLAASTAHVAAIRRGAVAQLAPVGVILIPFALLSIADVWGWFSFLISESYQLSLILLLLSVPIMVRLASVPFYEAGWLALGALIASAFLISLSKVSVGLVFTAGIAVLVLRSSGRWLKGMLIAGAIGGLGLAAMLLRTMSSAKEATTAWDPGHFLRVYPDGSRGNLVACLALLAAAAWLWRRADRQTQILVEVAVAMVSVALVPALLLRIDGGSADYFMNVGTWVAVVAGAAALAGSGLMRHYGMAAVIGATVASLVAMAFADGKASGPRTLDARADKLIAQLGGPAAPAVRPGWVWPLGGGRLANLAKVVDASPASQIRRQLVASGTLGQRDVLVHVLPDNMAYWKLSTYHCRNAPLLIPAVFGMPMLLGLPPASIRCDDLLYYGYPDYDRARSTARSLPDPALCDAARERGFKRVHIVETLTEGRLLACGPQ